MKTKNQRVLLKATIYYEKSYPKDWDTHQIEFHANESSWCLNNIIEDLEEFTERLDKDEQCLCNNVDNLIEVVKKDD